MSGHIKLYSCLCAESAETAEQIPDTCQGHFVAVVSEQPNLRQGAMTAGHWCGERLCGGGIRDLETPARRRVA